MNKRGAIIVGILVVIFIGIGGKFYMDSQENKDQLVLNAEKDLATFVVQNYKDVESIVFEEVLYSKETGTWSSKLNINEEDWLIFKFKIKESKTTILSSRYDKKEFSLISEKDNSKSIENIKVTYGGIR